MKILVSSLWFFSIWSN